MKRREGRRREERKVRSGQEDRKEERKARKEWELVIIGTYSVHFYASTEIIENNIPNIS